MKYDTFYTIQYRGIHIHVKHNRTLKREEFTIQGWPTVILLSLRSAKCRITKILGH